jgi:hypothetical protein
VCHTKQVLCYFFVRQSSSLRWLCFRFPFSFRNSNGSSARHLFTLSFISSKSQGRANIWAICNFPSLLLFLSVCIFLSQFLGFLFLEFGEFALQVTWGGTLINRILNLDRYGPSSELQLSRGQDILPEQYVMVCSHGMT